MAILLSYGSTGQAQHARPPPRRTFAKITAMLVSLGIVVAVVAVAAQVRVSALVQLPAGSGGHLHRQRLRSSGEREQTLLGFDPVRSNMRTRPPPAAGNTQQTVDAFERLPDQRDPLPSWATEWAEESRTKCQVRPGRVRLNTTTALARLLTAFRVLASPCALVLTRHLLLTDEKPLPKPRAARSATTATCRIRLGRSGAG